MGCCESKESDSRYQPQSRKPRVTSKKKRDSSDQSDYDSAGLPPLQQFEPDDYIAVWKYEAGSESEISCEKGDRLLAVDKVDDGNRDWIFLSRMGVTRSAAGYVQRSYVAKVGTEEVEPWFFGDISRVDAEDLLSRCADGTFLVRKQDKHSYNSRFVLSVQYSGTAKNYMIKGTIERQERFFIAGPKFKTLQDLVAFYRTTDDNQICHVLMMSPPKPQPQRKTLPDDLRQSWQEVPREDVHKETSDKGCVGSFLKATWIPSSGAPLAVFMKEFRLERGMSHQQFLAEAIVLKKLTNQPRIVKLLGVITSGEPHCIVTEYVKDGSLRAFLRKRKESAKWLDKRCLINTCTQISEALVALHSKAIIHGNLAAESILVDVSTVGGDVQVNIKLSEFGFAQTIWSTFPTRTENRRSLPVKWMAPEVITKGTYSHTSDVWSFAVVVFEVFNYGSEPYSGIPPDRIRQYVVDEKRLLEQRDTPEPVYRFLTQCWNHNPLRRPSPPECQRFFADFFTRQRKDSKPRRRR